jgi:hypothetical protein
LGDVNIKQFKVTNKKAFYLWAATSLVCMVVIFLFSSRDATASGMMSNALTRTILGAVWAFFAPAGQEVPESLIYVWEPLLRKAAHVFIFLLLGCSVANTIRQTTDSFRRIFIISLIWCSAYAAFDEIHQYFVPGRACMWQDWLLDTVGALLGITAVLYFTRRSKRKEA